MASKLERAEMRVKRLDYQGNRLESVTHPSNLCRLPEAILERGCDLKSSNPRDIIYALLSLTDCPAIDLGDQSPLSSGKLGVHIDYSLSVFEVFRETTRFIMNRVLDIGLPGSLCAWQP